MLDGLHKNLGGPSPVYPARSVHRDTALEVMTYGFQNANVAKNVPFGRSPRRFGRARKQILSL